MSASCNEVKSFNLDIDENARIQNDVFKYWVNKGNIRKRYTRPDGTFEQSIAEEGLKSHVWNTLDLPFVHEQGFTDKQISRIKVSIDAYNKDLTGKYRNIAGLFATPRGYARLDPTSKDMLDELEQAKNFERNRMSFVELGLQDIKDLVFTAHVDAGHASKIFKRNKSYIDFRKKRNEILNAKNSTLELGAYTEVEKFYREDRGRLLNEYRELVKLQSKYDKRGNLDNSELKTALEEGYKFYDPAVNRDKILKYDKRIILAVKETHKLLNKLGYVHINALTELQKLLPYKFSRFSTQSKNMEGKLQAAIDRIQNGIDAGNYFPKVSLESFHEIKAKLESILPEKGMKVSDNLLGELSTITDNLLVELDKQLPKNTKARSNNLNLLWESDPFVIIEKYSRDAIQFNKNIHIQSAYLKAMKNIMNADTDFLKGMKSFIMEEYLVSSLDGRGRAEWVNDMVRTVNGFQTARTMGANVTGGIKNAASVLHYMSKVGGKAILNAKRSYQNQEIRDIVNRVEQEEGFLFTPKDSEIVMEGLVGKESYRESDLVFDQVSGEYNYKGTPVKNMISKAGKYTLGKLLFFHRWTENGQRKFMFRTSFITKFNELKATSDLNTDNIIRYSKNFALKEVNGWAYEYASFAKNKYIRGSQDTIVDEVGENYIVKSFAGKGLKGGISEIAFHLMHYPMSLLETHISQLKGAGQSIKARQWDSSELQYLLRYGSLFGMIQLGSILLNANLNNILENETINRLARIEKDLTDYDDPDKATFGLLSEFSGPTIGHLKYAMIAGGLISLDTPAKKMLLGNVDYTEDTENSERYTAYQYSTEYGRMKYKILPALRDGRSIDVLRHYLAWYPSSWIKKARKSLGLKKKSKSKYTTEQVLHSLRQLSSNTAN